MLFDHLTFNAPSRLRLYGRWFPWAVADGVLSSLVWLCFWLIRKHVFEASEPDFQFSTMGLSVLVGLGWVFLFAGLGLYAPANAMPNRWVPKVFWGALLGTLLFFFVSFVNDPITSPIRLRGLFIGYFGLQLAAILLERTLLHVIGLRAGLASHKALLIGSGDRAMRLVKELATGPAFLKTEFVGYLALPVERSLPSSSNLRFLGGLGDLERVMQYHPIDELIVAPERITRHQLAMLSLLASHAGLRLKLPPELYKPTFGRYELLPVMNAPLLELRQRQFQPWEALLKRVFDIVFSLLLLALALPMLLVVGLFIKLDSRGPIIFAQERIGLNGKPFTLYKLRTMRVDAESSGPKTTAENDPRITRVGRWLRKMRIDEFPQLWNVLKGDMSVVGPRPERQYFIDKIMLHAASFPEVLTVKPGITGWGQVKNGYCHTMQDMLRRLRYDRLYIRNQSFWLDIRILWYSVAIVLLGRGR